MRIGILATGFNCADYLDRALEPWLQYKEKYNELIISAVSGLFTGNEVLALDNTKELMLHAFNTKQIHYLALPIGSFDEATIRNLALTPLLKENVDIVWLLDCDEIYTLEEIEKIIQFVNQDAFTACFRIEFKNYVFTVKTYIKGFAPRRIWRVNYGSLLKLDKFVWDNDAQYKNAQGDIHLDSVLPTGRVPIVTPKHFTWLNNIRSKNKILYQQKHFAHGAGCSFKWEDNQLKWNLDYFQKTGEAIPTIYEEKV